jgi:hypothetical protein
MVRFTGAAAVALLVCGVIAGCAGRDGPRASVPSSDAEIAGSWPAQVFALRNIDRVWPTNLTYVQGQGSKYLRIVETSLLRPNLPGYEDVFTMTGLVQNVGNETTTFRGIGIRGYNDQDEEVGHGAYYSREFYGIKGPWAIEPGAVAPFATKVVFGPGESQFLQRWSYVIVEVPPDNPAYEEDDRPFDEKGIAFKAIRAEMSATRDVNMDLNISNSAHSAKEGFVFLTTYDDSLKLVGVGCAEFRVPAAGSVAIAITENVASQPETVPTNYAIHFGLYLNDQDCSRAF